MAGAVFPELRPHQQAAMDAMAAAPGQSRYQFILPPGAGKTVLGAVAAARLARRTLVLVPNTAIQGQWLRLWTEAGSVSVSDDRSLDADVSVLTYQALATFDDDATGDSHVARLHPNARELIDALHGGPAFTLVLDEAHHLAQTWGELLAEVLQSAHAGMKDGPVVLALTATPRDSLSESEADLLDELFGPVRYAVSTPALVRDSVLAPYREFGWFVTPTPAERDYLAASAVRWRELIGAVMDPDFAQVGLLEYLDRAWVTHEGVSWTAIERSRPEVARALLRAAHNGLIRVPDGARMRDEHRQPMAVENWVALLSDYGRTVLAASDPPAAGWERLRAGLRSVGWTLTRSGARRGQSSVDRVLARSAAKAVAAGYLVNEEYLVRGSGLRAVVLTDYENVSATPPADIEAVIARQAGSAWEALAHVTATNPGLRVVLLTGSSVGGTPDALAALAGTDRRIVERAEGLAAIEATWTPRQWVPEVTRLFQEGAIQVLVGTRGLLGEGWDAPAANVLVDLTAATTSSAVVQIRGRAIRRDPRDPDKVAHLWSVTCVDDDHPRGDLDYRRLVAKHRGYLAPDADGRIVAGVEHLDQRCGPFSPPPADVRAAINSDALAAATRHDDTRTAWCISTPYRDVTETVVRVHADRRVDIGVAEPVIRAWPGWSAAAGFAGGVVAAGVGVAAQAPGPATAAVAACGAAAGWLAQASVRRWRVGAAARRQGADGMLLAFGRAVAATIGGPGTEAVDVQPDRTGRWVVALRGASQEQSQRFAQAFEQILLPIDFPRYVISRRLGTRRAVMWHAVPDEFGVNKASAEQFAEQWRTFVSRGDLLYTGSAEGTGVAQAVRGLDPMDLSTAMYAQWG
jgi:superfamily II DNA or RNA helicase